MLYATYDVLMCVDGVLTQLIHIRSVISCRIHRVYRYINYMNNYSASKIIPPAFPNVQRLCDYQNPSGADSIFFPSNTCNDPLTKAALLNFFPGRVLTFYLTSIYLSKYC